MPYTPSTARKQFLNASTGRKKDIVERIPRRYEMLVAKTSGIGIAGKSEINHPTNANTVARINAVIISRRKNG